MNFRYKLRWLIFALAVAAIIYCITHGPDAGAWSVFSQGVRPTEVLI